jgi:hypothetical protein
MIHPPQALIGGDHAWCGRDERVTVQLGVSSRMIVRPVLEDLGLLVMPILEGVDGRSAFQDGLRELAVVEPDVAQDRLLQILAGAEAVALQDKGKRPCIPGRKSRDKAIHYDKRRDKRRNRIEIMFGRLKDWRRVATRYDRCPKVFLSTIALAALVIYWLCILTLAELVGELLH